MIRAQRFLCFLLCAALCGCGYGFSGGGSLPGGLTSLHVRYLENRTTDIALSKALTDDLIYEFSRFGNIKLVGEAEADAVLSGTVKSVKTESVARKSGTSIERRVTVTVDLKLVGRDGVVLRSVKNASDNEVYTVVDSDNSAETLRNKRDAGITLSKRFARNLYGRMTDDF